ncbi:MAG: prolipoprotein diacylglyceryl transferase [Gammaproteobacteria bacterium]
MLTYPEIDPVAFQVFGLKVHWYGLMYLVAFTVAYWLGRRRASLPGSTWTAEAVSDLIFYAALGIVIGGRLGYMLFYGMALLLDNPLNLFKVWQGGMSFHGGLLGSACGMFWVARQHNKTMSEIMDFAAPIAALGLGFGRIGNFIGGELYGRVTTVPWGMVFPRGGLEPRHPSQLYEAFLEGLVLFVVLWWFSAKPRPRLSVTGLFILLYGVFRITVEFFREPDAHLSFIFADWVTMGQLLSLPMVLGGALMMGYAYQRDRRMKG